MKVFVTKYALSKGIVDEAEGKVSADHPCGFNGKIISKKRDKTQLFKEGEWFPTLEEANVAANTMVIAKADWHEKEAKRLRQLQFVTSNIAG